MKKHNKYILLLLFTIVFMNILNGQLTLKMDSAHVYLGNNSIEILTTDENGPLLDIFCSIKNSASDAVYNISGTNCQLSISFSVNDSWYFEDVVSSNFPYEKLFVLNQGEVLKFVISSYLFLGTDLMNNYNDKELCRALLKALPSIRLIYKDQNHFIDTRGIQNVVIKAEY